MFGFLNPLGRTERYRWAYARCLEHHRRFFGLRSLPFLSYESVFLYACWLDAAGMLHDDTSADHDIGRFCSAATLVLAQIKLDDEIRDGAPLLARGVYALLNDDFRLAREYFSKLDPAFEERVRIVIDRHLEMERSGVRLPLEIYVQPTADAFAYVFQLVSCLPRVWANAEVFAPLGAAIGSAFLACDCVIDWHDDRRFGTFNPLADADDVREACAFAEASVIAACDLVERTFGAASLSAEILRSVYARVMARLVRIPAAARQRNGHMLDELRRAVRSPVASHVDASHWSEFRDKLLLSCAVLAGDVVHRARQLWDRLRNGA
jgi:hypothetical protein